MNIITSLMSSMFSVTFPKQATALRFGIVLSDDDHRQLIDKLHELKYEEAVEDEGGTFKIPVVDQSSAYYTYTYTEDGVEWIQG